MQSNVLTNYPTEAGTERSSFPGNLPMETSGILRASGTFRPAFTIRAASPAIFLR